MASCVSLQSISCLCDLWVLLCVKTYHVFHFLVNNQIQQIKSCLFLQEQNKIHVATLWGLKWCEREIYIQVSIIQKLQRGKQNLFNFVLITLHVGNVVVNFLQYTKMQLEIYYILFSIFSSESSNHSTYLCLSNRNAPDSCTERKKSPQQFFIEHRPPRRARAPLPSLLRPLLNPAISHPTHPILSQLSQLVRNISVSRQGKSNIKPETKEGLLTDISVQKWGKNSLVDQ